MAVYKVGNGFQDAHGRAVNEDGTLLDPSADADNLSAQGAEGVVEPVVEAPGTETTDTPKAKGKSAAKKAKRGK